MNQAFDDFDLESIEEFYDAKRMHWISCDHCQELSLVSESQVMQSFEFNSDIILCKQCYKKMHKK